MFLSFSSLTLKLFKDVLQSLEKISSLSFLFRVECIVYQDSQNHSVGGKDKCSHLGCTTCGMTLKMLLNFNLVLC